LEEKEMNEETMKYGKRLKGFKSLNEISKELNVTKHRIYQMIEEGKLSEVYYIENVYVIPDAEYERFKEETKRVMDEKKDFRYKVKV
jgi:predicted DNA-binding protein YlxM (UPF0122 family)